MGRGRGGGGGAHGLAPRQPGEDRGGRQRSWLVIRSSGQREREGNSELGGSCPVPVDLPRQRHPGEPPCSLPAICCECARVCAPVTGADVVSVSGLARRGDSRANTQTHTPDTDASRTRSPYTYAGPVEWPGSAVQHSQHEHSVTLSHARADRCESSWSEIDVDASCVMRMTHMWFLQQGQPGHVERERDQEELPLRPRHHAWPSRGTAARGLACSLSPSPFVP